MRISILCSDSRHHVWPMLAEWAHRHEAYLTDDKRTLSGGDLLFLVSCTEMVGREIRSRFGKTLVIHESDLPQGRGWSPLAWQILEGRNRFTVTLLEAEDEVDSGPVWAKRELVLEGHELSGEINERRDAVRRGLMEFAVENFGHIRPQEQSGMASYYVRRTPADSRIDPNRSIASQFDLMRICDLRFPAFFELRGHRYEIFLQKAPKP